MSQVKDLSASSTTGIKTAQSSPEKLPQSRSVQPIFIFNVRCRPWVAEVIRTAAKEEIGMDSQVREAQDLNKGGRW